MPVNSIIKPNKNPIIVIIPNFFTFVKNNSKIMPPTSGTKTVRRTKKIGIIPSIATAKTTTKYIAVKTPIFIKSFPSNFLNTFLSFIIFSSFYLRYF